MGWFGQAVALLGFCSCVSTVVLGVTYLAISWPEDLVLRWSECRWLPASRDVQELLKWANCNTANNYIQGQTSWSAFFSVIGLLPAEPLIFGMLGIFMHRPCLLQLFGFPRNFLQYACFLILQALFGNFSYCGKLGVAVAYLSLVSAGLSLLCQLLGVRSDWMIRLAGSRHLRKHFRVEEETDIASADERGGESEEENEEEEQDMDFGVSLGRKKKVLLPKVTPPSLTNVNV